VLQARPGPPPPNATATRRHSETLVFRDFGHIGADGPTPT